MVFPASSLVSDCCQGLIIMDGSSYQCIKCKKPCKSGGTLADLAAPRKERERLEREVIEAAKKYQRAVREHMEYVNECMARDRSHDEDEDPKWEGQLGAQCTTEYALSKAVDALIEFESSQQQPE